MPRGSRKGEHRGNAKPRVQQEDARDVMRDALARKSVPSVPQAARVERRVIQAQRNIRMAPHDVTQMTPKDVLLDNMHFYMQGAVDWQGYLEKAMSVEPTPDSMEDVAAATVQIERFRRLASDDAYKVAPYIHPRLAAILTSSNAGENQDDVIRQLLEDIDARQRAPKVIEHQEKPEPAE